MKRIYQHITINQEQNNIVDKKLLTIYLNLTIYISYVFYFNQIEPILLHFS